MDPKLIELLTPLARSNAQLIEVVHAHIAAPVAPAAEDSGITVREVEPASRQLSQATPIASPVASSVPVHAPVSAPKAEDELAEQIMVLLETKPDGMTPRDLGKALKVAHQSYRFRKAMLGLKKEGRLELLDSDNPKKLRYRIVGFAAATE